MPDPYFDPAANWQEITIPEPAPDVTPTIMARLANWYCRNFHRKIMTPVNGKYECSVCQRRFKVEW